MSEHDEMENKFEDYVKNNLAEEVANEGTAIPADSIAQIIQEIIKIDPELKNYFGPEIRTGFMDEETYFKYTRLLMYAYHILIRGFMFKIPVRNTVKDILFGAKVLASASTSKGGKLLETLVMSKREVNVNMGRPQKRSVLSR